MTNNLRSLFLVVLLSVATSTVCFGQKAVDAVRGTDAFKAIEQGYDYDVFFPWKDDTIHRRMTEPEALKALDKVYKTCNVKVKKEKDVAKRATLQQLNDDCRRNFTMRIIDEKTPEYKQLVEGIDVNNPIGLYNYLPMRFIEHYLTGHYDSVWGADTTPYGLEYMAVMRRYVTNAEVKHALLDFMAGDVLNYGKGFPDIDRFWKPFVAYAGTDSDVIAKYQYKVDALKKTKRGMPAPDFAMTDSTGTVHHLSDYRGRTVYIDCWATWCGPCCKEIPFLEKRVAEYKGDDRVVFLSISMDSNRNAWLKKIRKDRPAWPQFIVTSDQHADLSRLYGITGIPRFIVVRADGTLGDADAFRPSDDHFHPLLDAMLQ